MNAPTASVRDPFAASASVSALSATGLVAIGLVGAGLAGAVFFAVVIWFAVGAGAGYSLSGSV